MAPVLYSKSQVVKCGHFFIKLRTKIKIPAGAKGKSVGGLSKADVPEQQTPFKFLNPEDNNYEACPCSEIISHGHCPTQKYCPVRDNVPAHVNIW